MNLAILLLCATLPAVVDHPPAGAIKLLKPGTRADQTMNASSSRAPWVDSNGWHFHRNPAGTFLYEGVAVQRLPLAAAEAFSYGAKSVIQTDEMGKAALKPMLSFLEKLDDPKLPPVADIFVHDDGTPILGEVMNLLSRRNLLFEAGKKPAKSYKLVVEVGSADFPKKLAVNPSDFARLVRKKLTDEKRSLRIYGSEIIVGYLTSDGKKTRLHLLNYATDPIESFRVRILGDWKFSKAASYNDPSVKAEEITYYEGGTDFTVSRLTTYAVYDFVKK